MTIQVELSPEKGAQLKAEAAARGISLEQSAELILRSHAPN